MNSPQLETIDYLAEVAKDWVLSRFAAAESSDYVLDPHRFQLDQHSVRRQRLARRSREATDPLNWAGRPPRPLVWARSAVSTLRTNSESGSGAYEQEVVEIIGVDGADMLVETAFVVRIPGLPPCLGRFYSAV